MVCPVHPTPVLSLWVAMQSHNPFIAVQAFYREQRICSKDSEHSADLFCHRCVFSCFGLVLATDALTTAALRESTGGFVGDH